MKPKGIGVDRYRELASQGMTVPQTARALGVSKTTVQGVAKRNDIAFEKGKAWVQKDVVTK